MRTLNSCYSATIRFQRIWWIKEFGGVTGYSLVLVHYFGTGKLWWIKRFGGYRGGGLTRIHCTYIIIWQCLVYVFLYLPSAHLVINTVLFLHTYHCSPKFIKPVRVTLEPSSTVEDVITKTLGEIEIVVSYHSNGIGSL